MSKPGKTGLVRVLDACGYSVKGLKASWKYEAAFRQELILCCLLVPFALLLCRSHIELILLLLALFLVVMAELANSAIEAVVDRTGSEYHELSGRAKDIGSALVFVSLILCAVIWGIILCSRFF